MVGPLPAEAQKQGKAKDDPLVLERFKIHRHGDALLVPVTFKEKEYTFVIDTGASHTVYDISLPLGAVKDKLKVDSAGGPVVVSIFAGQTSSLGKLKIEPGEFSPGIDLAKIREVSGYPIYGVLGMDFLNKHVVQIDFDEGELVFLKKARPGAGTAFPLEVSQMKPLLKVKLHDKGDDGRELDFLIDTGSVGLGSGGLKKELVAELEKQGGLRVVGQTLTETAKGTTTNRLVQQKKTSLGDFVMADAVFSEGRHNLIGLGFLSRFKVTFDFPGQTLHLEKGKRFEDPDRWDLSGLHLVRKEGRTVVHSVDKESPAASSGIKAGDVLVQAAGKATQPMSLFELRRLFCEPGGKIGLVVQRQEQRLDVAVELPTPKK